jgi:hypothetical protein
MMEDGMMTDYYSDLDRAKALGLEYATNGIAGGEFRPQESPLSAEWAGSLTVQDIARMLGANPDRLEGFEFDDIASYWEDGYNSAECPLFDGNYSDRAIVGYMFHASEYSPAQLHSAYIERWISQGVCSPAARDMSMEDILDQRAAAEGIDRADEYSFDSDEFPKVILFGSN